MPGVPVMIALVMERCLLGGWFKKVQWWVLEVLSRGVDVCCDGLIALSNV
jgi:hypothetical protein